MNNVSDPDNYTIYLVNKSANTQVYWCFLEPPKGLNDSGVFANSSTSLAVTPNYPGVNTFTIPVQYVLAAGASNHAVGLNIKIDSSITNDVNLKDVWEAEYATVPPNQGPNMTRTSTSSDDSTITYNSNKFDQVKNENASWFSSMTFGIQTNQGFIGMTWAPAPNSQRVITPKLNFYVATGKYGSNELADFTDISRTSAQIPLSKFERLKATVTLEADGSWTVTPGAPKSMNKSGEQVDSLIQSHYYLSKAQSELVDMARASDYLSGEYSALEQLKDYQDMMALAKHEQKDRVQSVKWDKSPDNCEDVADVVITGTLTVGTALTAAFTGFILAGVRFRINRSEAGVTSFHFSYSGTRSASAIKSLFEAGSSLLLYFRNNEVEDEAALLETLND